MQTGQVSPSKLCPQQQGTAISTSSQACNGSNYHDTNYHDNETEAKPDQWRANLNTPTQQRQVMYKDAELPFWVALRWFSAPNHAMVPAMPCPALTLMRSVCMLPVTCIPAGKGAHQTQGQAVLQAPAAAPGPPATAAAAGPAARLPCGAATARPALRREAAAAARLRCAGGRAGGPGARGARQNLHQAERTACWTLEPARAPEQSRPCADPWSQGGPPSEADCVLKPGASKGP